jgi:linoleoyl-CoA desaturase
MSIGHDAVHGAYSRRRRLNRVLGLVMDVMGASSYMWRLTHNGAHHTYTNIDPVDTDLDYGSVLRMGPSAKPRFFHRWQSHYAFLVYALVVLYWICVRDIRYFVRRRVGPYRDLRHPRMAWTAFLAGRAIVVTYMIVVPLVVLSPSWWQFAIGFGTTAVVWGITMAIVFQLAHFVEGLPMLPLPADGLTVDDFFAHQLRSTADFATQNAALSWYVGGLNFQIEHHLFPKVCSVHYPALRPIVRELAARHGLPYYEFPTLRSALRSHVAYLERWGRPEAEGAERARPLAPASVSPSLPVYPGRMP